MKQSIIAIVILFTINTNYTQKLEKVYSITKDIHELSWYQTQSKLWKAEIDNNSKDANAWYNYYAANRALRNLSWKDTANTSKYGNICNKIAKDVYVEIPNTFEANHIQWWNGSNQPEYLKYLMKANEISPNNPKILNDLMTHYELTQDLPKYKEASKNYFYANELPAALLNWGYNILAEVDKNAIILTGGDNDTYPIWTVQEAKNFRLDVKNINTSLILDDEYRDKIFAKLNIPKLDQKMSDVKTPQEWEKFQKSIYNQIFTKYTNGPVYISGTVISKFKDYSDKLFLTGLAYKYADEGFDNLSIIKRNFEKRYLLDYLQEIFSYNMAAKVAYQMDATYLPAMMKLYKAYRNSEDEYRKNKLLQLIILISERSGRQTEISELLEEDNTTSNRKPYRTMLLNAKKLERKFMYVKSATNIYMGMGEVSNEDYSLFLDNLKRSRLDNTYNICIYDSTQWNKSNPNAFLEPMVNLYHWHPAYFKYPVVNITYEAAVLYCDWLTVQYNSQRKRKYTQVIFRLPTEDEWKLAATAGYPKNQTPWGETTVTNEKGCYLANIKTDIPNDDGGMLTVSEYSYFPNDYGLYNVMGNVAEMTSEQGIAKGGSWNHTFVESKFSKSQKYDGANPSTGFRVLMEIIQE